MKLLRDIWKDRVSVILLGWVLLMGLLYHLSYL